VHHHGTCPAGGIVTAALGTGQTQVLAQRIEQQCAGRDRDLMRTPVDLELDQLFFHDSYWLSAANFRQNSIRLREDSSPSSALLSLGKNQRKADQGCDYPQRCGNDARLAQ